MPDIFPLWCKWIDTSASCIAHAAMRAAIAPIASRGQCLLRSPPGLRLSANEDLYQAKGIANRTRACLATSAGRPDCSHRQDYIDLCDVLLVYGAPTNPSVAEMAALVFMKIGGVVGRQVEALVAAAGRFAEVTVIA